MPAPDAGNAELLKVLITDDHAIVREGIRSILSDDPGIGEIHEASNGSEMIEMILLNDYDVVLLDISLPGKNGLELLKDISFLKPEIPVIIISNLPASMYASCACNLGAAGYISKADAGEHLTRAIQIVASGGKFFLRA